MKWNILAASLLLSAAACGGGNHSSGAGTPSSSGPAHGSGTVSAGNGEGSNPNAGNPNSGNPNAAAACNNKATLVTGNGNNLVWSDEFNGATLDTNVWVPAVVQNAFGTPTNFTASPNNAYLDGQGNLVLKNLKPADGKGNWTGPQLSTRCGGVSFKYGYIEERAKMSNPNGTWHSFWMSPTDSTYGGWPLSGEVDILEWLGVAPTVAHNDAHWGLAWNQDLSQYTAYDSSIDLSADYHVYGLNWTPTEMTWTLDGKVTQTLSSTGRSFPETPNGQWPFDERFYILLSQNIGSSSTWPGPADPGLTEASVLVDYVRVYQYH